MIDKMNYIKHSEASYNPSLACIKNGLKANKVILTIKKGSIEVTAANHACLVKEKDIKNLLNSLLNCYENKYFITLKNIPYCYLPGSDDHNAYIPKKDVKYLKIDSCKLCKYCPKCPGYEASALLSALRPESLMQPVYDLPNEIILELNKECNLKCKMCLTGSTKERAADPDRKIYGIMDEMADLGIKNIRFTGGEPCLAKNLIEMLEYAKKKRFYILLNTNATVLEKAMIAKLTKLADNILVSFQGYDPASEQTMTQGGAFFKRKLDTIARLRDSKIMLRSGSVISKILLKNFAKFSNLMDKLKVDSWELYRPMVKIAALSAHPELNISQDDIKYLSRKIKSAGAGLPRTIIANPVPFCCDGADKLFFLGARFDDGHSRMVFDSSGFFKPSYFINMPLGSKILPAWNHPFVKNIRSLKYLPPNCLQCHDIQWCLGGSRFWANEYSGSYFSADPWMKENGRLK